MFISTQTVVGKAAAFDPSDAPRPPGVALHEVEFSDAVIRSYLSLLSRYLYVKDAHALGPSSIELTMVGGTTLKPHWLFRVSREKPN